MKKFKKLLVPLTLLIFTVLSVVKITTDTQRGVDFSIEEIKYTQVTSEKMNEALVIQLGLLDDVLFKIKSDVGMFNFGKEEMGQNTKDDLFMLLAAVKHRYEDYQNDKFEVVGNLKTIHESFQKLDLDMRQLSDLVQKVSNLTEETDQVYIDIANLVTNVLTTMNIDDVLISDIQLINNKVRDIKLMSDEISISIEGILKKEL